MNNNKGFTLIELLAVVLLISIITAASFPSVKSMIKDNKKTKQEYFARVLEYAAKNYVLKNKVKSKSCFVITYSMLKSDNLIEDLSGDDDLNCTDKTCFVAVCFNEKGKPTKYYTKVGDVNASNMVLSGDTGLTINGENVTTSNEESIASDLVEYERKPNAPVYDRDVMIPVVYTYDYNYDTLCENSGFPSDWTYCNYEAHVASTSNKGNYAWYDYSKSKWANVVTCKSDYRNECLSTKVGDVLNSDWINSYWVWIPRYEYKADLKSGSGNEKMIDVNFISKYTTTATKGYKIQDAFSFNNGNSILSGIWVAKFEASKTQEYEGSVNYIDVVNIGSGYSWTNITLDDAFVATRKMETKDNPYGFKQEADSKTISGYGYIKDDSNNLDTHLIQNSEWGAAAYLSQSKYSKRCNIETKKCDDVEPDASVKTIDGGVKFNTGYSKFLYYTNWSKSTNVATLNNLLSDHAHYSISFNNSGVYGMSGGAFDMVMGWKTKSFSKDSLLTDSQYSNIVGITSIYNKNSRYECSDEYCNEFYDKDFGHAMSETYRWYSNYHAFSNDSYPLLMRGGCSGDPDNPSGIFSYRGTNNIPNEYKGFRPVLIMW